jgi:hypothetical protein
MTRVARRAVHCDATLIDQLSRGASAKLGQPRRNRFIEAIGFFDEECLRFTRTHVLDVGVKQSV